MVLVIQGIPQPFFNRTGSSVKTKNKNFDVERVPTFEAASTPF